MAQQPLKLVRLTKYTSTIRIDIFDEIDISETNPSSEISHGELLFSTDTPDLTGGQSGV